jgi:hypothetical protein
VGDGEAITTLFSLSLTTSLVIAFGLPELVPKAAVGVASMR